MINITVMYHNPDIPRQGMDSFESRRACLPAVAMPVARSVPVSLPAHGLSVGTVIGCPPMPAFSPPLTVRVEDEADHYLTSWGESQQPSSSLTSLEVSEQISSTYLTSWRGNVVVYCSPILYNHLRLS